MRPPRFAVFALILLAGCTNYQLRRSTVHQASTLPDLQHQIVLDNLAAFACNPDAIPFQVNLRDGSAQISDSGTTGGTVGTPTITGWLATFGGTRTKTDQWGMVPVTDETTLRLLRIAYRRALGCPEDLYTTDFANDLAHDLAKQTPLLDDIRMLADLFKGSPKEGIPEKAQRQFQEMLKKGIRQDECAVPAGLECKTISEYKHFVESTISTGSVRIILKGERVEDDNVMFVKTNDRYLVATPLAAEVRRQIHEIEEDLEKIQPGWVGVACNKKDVPKCACLVGHYKNCGKCCFVWVLPEGRAAFEDFTLRILKFSSLLKEAQVFTMPGVRYVPSPVGGTTGPTLRVR